MGLVYCGSIRLSKILINPIDETFTEDLVNPIDSDHIGDGNDVPGKGNLLTNVEDTSDWNSMKNKCFLPDTSFVGQMKDKKENMWGRTSIHSCITHQFHLHLVFFILMNWNIQEIKVNIKYSPKNKNCLP